MTAFRQRAVSAVATAVARSTETNAEGSCTVAGLDPGTYSARVELAGFAPLPREAVLAKSQAPHPILPIRPTRDVRTAR